MSLPVLLLTFFFAVIKRPWIVMLTVLVVMIPVTYALFSKVPIYESGSKIMVAVEGTGVLDEVAVLSRSMPKSSAKPMAYYLNILKSREYKEIVANRIREAAPTLSSDSVQIIVDNIIVNTNPREEGFITIHSRLPSPKLAYMTASTALEEFKNRCINLEREEGQNVAYFIDAQIDQTSEKMEHAEGELQRFLSEKNLINVDAEAGVGKELIELERSYSEAMAGLEMVRINIESYNNQINKLLDNLARTDVDSELEEDIAALRRQLDEIKEKMNLLELTSGNQQQLHELQQERKEILNELVQLTLGQGQGTEQDKQTSILSLHELQRQLDMALLEEVKYANQVDFYQIRIDRFRREHPNLPKDILEYARLVRAKDVLQKTLEILLEKREEARIRLAAEQGGVKIIDEPAYPTKPIAESKMSKTALALVISVVLGVLLSAAVDYFDGTIKDENDVRKVGVSPLGAIPVFVPKSGLNTAAKSGSGSKMNPGVRGRHMLIFESQKSYVAEAYRSLKISLQFAATDRGKNVFVISSPGVGEGKSLTAANLAIAFAQGGKKTLIMDLDLRRSTQNRFFDVPRKPGITEYLLEGIELESITRETGVANLTLVTGGSAPPNPAELVSSRAMGDFINQMRSEFDIVLIDTPPILVCTDPMSVADYSDGMIIMVKMEHTNMKTLDYAVNTVRKINIEVMGVILNHTSYRYGTAYYYFYRYYRPYTYYSTYRYYSYYYGDYGQASDGTRKRRRRRKKLAASSNQDSGDKGSAHSRREGES